MAINEFFSFVNAWKCASSPELEKKNFFYYLQTFFLDRPIKWSTYKTEKDIKKGNQIMT